MNHRVSTHSTAIVTAVVISCAASLGMSSAQAADKVHVALGDVVSVERLAFLVAMERGVDYELTSCSKEELAIQSRSSTKGLPTCKGEPNTMQHRVSRHGINSG